MLIKSYDDMVKELEIHERLYDIAETNYEYYKRMFNKMPKDVSGINYDGMPKGNNSDISFDRIIECMVHWKNEMETEKEHINRVADKIKEIDCIMESLEGIECQIIYKRDVKKKSLQQIADELGYAYQTIANISAKYDRVKIE